MQEITLTFFFLSIIYFLRLPFCPGRGGVLLVSWPALPFLNMCRLQGAGLAAWAWGQPLHLSL